MLRALAHSTAACRSNAHLISVWSQQLFYWQPQHKASSLCMHANESKYFIFIETLGFRENLKANCLIRVE